ncbi:MAG: YbhB/YbcL family Raf kinase inhibitor-like protein [Deltaproteobacteria bacterium]|nr:MAG: YbhB/YbcL family Raf kinase inhibitor-like protein [Deltaproteobacteria bacterium]
MKLWSDSFSDGDPIPGEFAFAVPHPENHIELAGNRNPHLAWSGLPEGTKSLALVCIDTDVPTDGTHVNQEGAEVPADLPRTDFVHWALVGLPADAEPIAPGEFSNGVDAHGKPGPEGPRGTRQGVNDYTGWFEGDASMAGDYHGYDGPCPPWNDTIIHHYHFTLYALDTDALDLPDKFSGGQLLDAMEGHVLGSASLVGTYTLNPKLR